MFILFGHHLKGSVKTFHGSVKTFHGSVKTLDFLITAPSASAIMAFLGLHVSTRLGGALTFLDSFSATTDFLRHSI